MTMTAALRILGLVAIALLSACSSLYPPNRTPAPVETSNPPATGTNNLPSAPASPASILLASVAEAIAAGDLERAAALCERALRIAPRDGQLWYKLATIRFEQKRYTDAAGFARRALSFATTDAVLRAQSDELLKQAEVAARNIR